MSRTEIIQETTSSDRKPWDFVLVFKSIYRLVNLSVCTKGGGGPVLGFIMSFLRQLFAECPVKTSLQINAKRTWHSCRVHPGDRPSCGSIIPHKANNKVAVAPIRPPVDSIMTGSNPMCCCSHCGWRLRTNMVVDEPLCLQH